MNRILRIDNVRKTVNYLKKNGLAGTFYAAVERVQEEKRADYHYTAPDAKTLAKQRRETADDFCLFSIVTPAYETKEAYLREMIASVRAQSYPRWELIIVDASAGDAVERTVRQIIHETGDLRIRYSRLHENKGIAENTNAGIALAGGDYIALLDHDDFITPDALYEMASCVRRGRREGCPPVLLYSDEDKYDECAKTFVFPNRKKNFNLDLILSNNYICHFMAVEAGLMKRLKLRAEYDGAQDYDLVLRVVDSLWPDDALVPEEGRIRHIPKVLYHWRSHRDSTALNTGSKTYAYEAGRRALADFCAGRGFRAQVEHSLHLGFYRIVYEPDLLGVRRDVGMVGGRILDGKRRIFTGGYDEKGQCLYKGLPARFTGGSTHLAVLKQDCAAVDIRCMRLRENLQPLYSEITGLPYREKRIQVKEGRKKKEICVADVSGLTCDEAGYRKLSMALGEAVRRGGYLVVWDPGITMPHLKKSGAKPQRDMSGTDGRIRSTIVIPNYNGIKYIENCLVSLAGEPARVIVVDNASKDGSRELVQEKFPTVLLLSLDQNYGFCTAVNRGIAESEKDKTTYVILLNNDTVVEPGFVRTLERALDRDHKAFSAAARMVNLYHPERIDDAGDYYCALGWAFAAGKDKPATEYDKPRQIFSACGGACIYRRSILDQIGLLDENHFAYLEDVDIGYRARIYGYRNLYVPEAVVRHAGSGASGSRHNAFKVKLSARNNVYLLCKNMPPAQILINLPFLLAGFLIKTLFFVKKKLGKSWFRGTAEGLRLACSESGKKKRVRFAAARFPAYAKIQWELWRNLWYRIRL